MTPKKLKDSFWEKLLDYVDEGRVVPIVGPDLSTVTLPGSDAAVPLDRHIATQLADSMEELEDVDLGEDHAYTLNDVVCKYLETPKAVKAEIYSNIQRLLKTETFAPSQCLRDLASIDKLRLFVSTTFDSQLVDAINALRGRRYGEAEVVSYAPGKVNDLRANWKSTGRRFVFHLLGKASTTPDYVVCDEDLLEFLHAIQAESKDLPLLFDELKNSHLLLLGCSFADWLSPLFVRLAKGQKLSTERGEFEYVVNTTAAQDSQLTLFYDHFSNNTKMISLTPAEFVAELARRWHQRHPPQEEAPDAAPVPAVGEDAGVIDANAIFISYASEDVEAAERIKIALEAADLVVWFDKNRLGAGESWDYKIRANIRNCALFVPVISAATEQKVSYFRKEWAWADDRALEFPPSMPFLVPVALDPIKPETAEVPERFRVAQWTRLPGGQVTDEFAQKLKQLVRDRQKRQQAA